MAFITKFVAGVGVILIVSFCMRGFGRAQNATYQTFLDVLKQAEKDIAVAKPELMKYDFDFGSWPVEYDLSGTKRLVAR